MALLDFLTITPKASIGGIEIQASIEEMHTDSVQATEHPVESGPTITDHAFVRPKEVVLRCGWSNSGIDSLIESVTGIVDGLVGDVSTPGTSGIDGVYSKLRALMESRQPFDITTTRRQYSNMLLVGLQVTTDVCTHDALMVTATCREIIIVSTQVVEMPPKESQANPANTNGVADSGVKQPQAGATPSPGGAVAPSQWGNEARR